MSGQATPEAESLCVGLQGELHSVPLSIHLHTQTTVCKEAREVEDGQRAYPKSLGSRRERGTERKPRGSHGSGERSHGAQSPRRCTDQDGQTRFNLHTCRDCDATG